MAELAPRVDPEIGEQLFGGARYGAGLLGALRAMGLAIGPREQVAVSALIAELIATSDQSVSLADLGPHLAPLLARSPSERETFFQVFDTLAPTRRSTTDGVVDPAPAPRLLAQKARSQRRSLTPRTLIIGVIVAGCAGATAYLVHHRLNPPALPVAPPAVSDILDPAPSQPAPALVQFAAPQTMVGLNRVRRAAEQYFSAPTLEELGRDLATPSPIGWSAEAYTKRLHELTGLPQRTPLTLLGTNPGTELAATQTARLAAAVDEIERPGRAASVAAMETFLIETGAVRSLFDVSADDAAVATAEALALQLQQRFPSGMSPLANDKPATMAAVGDVLGVQLDPLLIERALAVAPQTSPSIHRVWPDAPWLAQAPPPNTSFAPWWALILAAALPLLAGLAWLAHALRHKKAFLRRRRPEFPPLHMDLLAEAKTQIKANAALFQRAAQRLARRTPRDTDTLDIERTIAATLQDGGLMVKPVFARTRTAPEYLVLIEKRAAGDHDYERLRSMVLRLSDLVTLDIYSYQTEPSLLEADRGGRFEPIDRLSAKYPDHRLLVLGSGDGFLDVRARKPLPSAEKLMRWERRALLTPLPLSEWAQEEINLARELEMPIGRATPEGIAALAELLGLEGTEDEDLLRPIGDGRARPLPDILRLRGAEFLFDEPPDTHPVGQVVQDLRNYLDAEAFDWLCALAVYPAIQWDLTLYLGVALAEKAAGNPKIAPLYSEERLAALTQLPWFREGAMPNWLRGALITQLPRDREIEIRGVIHRLLESAQPRETQAENDQIWFRIGEEPMKESRSPEVLFEDEVLLDFMARGAIEDFDYSRQVEKREVHSQFGWLHAAGLGVASLYAVAALTVAPKPWEGALITGAWLPLVVMALGAGLALVAINGSVIYRLGRAWLEQASPYGLAFAGLLGGLWAVGSTPELSLGAAEPLMFGLALIASAAAARWMARQAGVFLPDGERPWLKFLGIAVALAATGLLALVLHVLAREPLQKALLIVLGLGLFAAGVVAARYAPEKLRPPKTKLSLGPKLNRWAEAGRASLVLAGALPALLLAWHFNETHVRVPPLLAANVAPLEGLMASSSDGRFFATGGVDGVVRVFDAARPRNPLVTLGVESGTVCQSTGPNACDPLIFTPPATQGPVITLAIQNLEDGRLIVAAATRDGMVKLFDGRGGSLIQDTGLRSIGLRPLIALGADGGWAVARQDEAGASVLATNAGLIAIPQGGPILTMTAGEAAQTWALSLSDGRLALAFAGALRFAAPDVRLPGRARQLSVTGSIVRAIGDDGSVLEAEIAPQGLANARLLAPDPRLALGPAVGWQVSAPANPEMDLAVCTTLAQEIQATLSGQAPGTSPGAGPRLAALQAQFAQNCPGLTFDGLAAPIESPDVDLPLCASYAREWAALTLGQRQAQRDIYLNTRVPNVCPRLREEIRAVKSGSEVVDEQVISTATTAGRIFRDRAEGVLETAIPEMVVIPAGEFLMGSPASERGRDRDEGPLRWVTIAQPFAVGRFEVTFQEWAACVAGGGCRRNPNPSDEGWGRGQRPVIRVSWNDAQNYVVWLTRVTGQRYRLLTEAEWEYAARAGTTTTYATGDSITGRQARFNANSTIAVGSFVANQFGLHDMQGNVREWVQDCYSDSYDGLPANALAYAEQGCSRRVIRGASWNDARQSLRSANRDWERQSFRVSDIGFRVARVLYDQ
jgi:formylglycine-generating enzyme required for sulfatase activity